LSPFFCAHAEKKVNFLNAAVLEEQEMSQDVCAGMSLIRHFIPSLNGQYYA
jgi:hypothetical protein